MTNDINKFNIKVSLNGRIKNYSIQKDKFILGRSNKADLCIDEDKLSRQHLEVSFEKNKIWIKDLDSANGSVLNQARLDPFKKTEYQSGDMLYLGDIEGFEMIVEHSCFEVDTFSMKEEINHQLKVANGTTISLKPHTPPPIVEAPKKLKLVDEQHHHKDRSQIFDRIKEVLELETESIREMAQIEAKETIEKAQHEAHELIHQAQKEIVHIRQGFHHDEAKLKQLVDDLTSRKSDLEAEVNLLKDDLVHLKSTLEHQEGQSYEITQKLEEQEHNLEKIYQKIHEADADHKEAIRRMEQEEKRFQVKIETEEAQWKLKLIHLQSEIEKTQTNKALLQSDYEHLEERKNKITQDVEFLSDKKQSLHDKISDIEHEIHVASLERDQAKINLEKINEDLKTKYHDFDKIKKDISDSKHLAEEIESNAQKQAKEIIKNAENESAQLLRDVTNKNEKTIQDAERKALEILDKSQANAKQIIAEATSKAENIIKSAQHDGFEITKKAKEELQKINIEIIDIKNGFELKRNQLKSLYEEEVAKDRQALKQSIEDLKAEELNKKEEINLYVKTTKEKADEEAKKIKSKAENYLQEAQKKSEVMINNLMEELKEKRLSAERLQESRLQAHNKTMEDLLLKEDKLKYAIDELDRTKEELLKDAHLEAQRILEKVELEKEEMRTKMNADFEEEKKRQSQLLGELRVKETHAIQQHKAKEEQEIFSKKQEKAKALGSSFYSIVTNELKKSRSKNLSDEVISQIARDVKEVTVDTLLGKTPATSEKLKEISKLTSDPRDKDKKFWRKTMMVTTFTLVIGVILIQGYSFIGSRYDQMKASSGENQQKEKDQILNKIKEKKELAKFRPKQNHLFKTSYVDNILYTQDYLSKKQNKDHQDKWVLELNDFFIYKIDVSDTAIIKFISMESTLLRDLTKIQENIPADNPGPSIAKMQSEEQQFKQKLRSVLGDDIKVQKFYDFSATFWKNYHKENK